MKKLIIICSFIFAGAAGAAAQSMLKVRLADSRQINVAVDERYFNKLGTSITVGELPPGMHSLRIYSVTYTRRGRPFRELVYEGTVRTYNDNRTLFTFDPNTRETYVQEEDMNGAITNRSMPNQPVPDQPVPNQPVDNSNMGNGREEDMNSGRGEETQRNDDNNYAPPSSPVASPVAVEEAGTLTDAKTDKLKTKVTAKKTDTEKMTVLKDALKNEKITTNQVSYMMDWFSFESSKVDFAKWAYPNTVDKENYSNIAAKLSYKNYQEDLEHFIDTKK